MYKRQVLDGAHNPHAAEALANTWEVEFPNQSPIVVFAAVEGKDIVGVLDQLSRVADSFIFTSVSSQRAIEPGLLQESLEASLPSEIVLDFAEAYGVAKEKGKPILIAGSLFLIGQAKAFFDEGSFESSMQ